MTVSSTRPIRVAVEDCELVRAGLAHMLEPYADRISLQTSSTEVDVVLTAEPQEMTPTDVDQTVRVLFAWGETPRAGVVSKQLSAPGLVRELERIARDGRVAGVAPQARRTRPPAGLSDREAEILALIGSGRSNDEVAAYLYLSINTVKSYVRTAYRKIGATRRSQAVLWVVAHDLPLPERR